MASVRNISDDTLEVRCSGVSLGEVAPDAVLNVDDDLFAGHAWPETVWAVVAASQPTAPAQPTEPAPVAASEKE